MIGLVTYSMGSGGGLRVQTPLKAMVTDIGMFTVPASVKVDFVNKKFDENGKFAEKIIYLTNCFLFFNHAFPYI